MITSLMLIRKVI